VLALFVVVIIITFLLFVGYVVKVKAIFNVYVSLSPSLSLISFHDKRDRKSRK
jgi:hypothetical protein